MNYENVVLIFKNRFPTGNTYSFIHVEESYQRKPDETSLMLNGLPHKLVVLAYDITKRWNTKTDWISREVDIENGLFVRNRNYLYKLDDGRFGTANFETGVVHAFENDNAAAIIHAFFYNMMSL
jgi:hypothetical protein